MMRLVIMASGFSRRMGQDKLLTPLQGKPLLAWVIEAALTAGVGEISIVYRDPDVQKIADFYGIRGIYNPLAEQGQSAGIKLAVDQLPDSQAYLFLAGDQPLVTPDTLRRMQAAYLHSRPDIVTAAWHGKRCLPALFDASMAASLASLQGDRGGRMLIESGRFNVVSLELGGEEESWDADTPTDLLRIENWLDATGMTGRPYDKKTH